LSASNPTEIVLIVAPKVRSGITLVVFGLIVVVVFLFVVEHKFKSLSPNVFYSGCFKMWAHRGYFLGGTQQNSIGSFQAAFNLGAKAIELDIHYDLSLNDYVVSHDFPYALKDGKLLLLEEVFKNFSTSGFFWLDFKNLRRNLSSDSTNKAINRLVELTKKYNLKEKIIIESPDPIRLLAASRRGFFTSYWIRPYIDRQTLQPWHYFLKVKFFLLYGNFSALSMNHIWYTDDIEKVFKHIPIHLFTVNNQRRLVELMEKDSVKIILTDQKFYSQNTCIEGVH